ncbi:MAG: DUF4102 domain-containing protein [Gammaproteobacteria bacterium]|nr:MAG: DUF4102 domain-containing protein [Gammaproteobacteria bacterium]
MSSSGSRCAATVEPTPELSHEARPAVRACGRPRGRRSPRALGGLLEAGTAVIVARRSPKPKKAKFVHVRAKVPSIPRHPGPQTGVPCLASNKAQPRRKPFEIYASRLPGFTLRVQPSGVRWYYARFRRNRRVVLGKVGTVAPEDARDRC